MTSRILCIVLAVLMAVVCLPLGALAEQETRSDNIVILYTNDVHSYIDGPLSYDVIAAVKQELQKQYQHVLLADAGDHVQGTAYGSMDKGKSIVSLMNAAGYDVATFGNHEFDYGVAGCFDVISWADYPYVSCNFYQQEQGVRGENVVEGYTLFGCGDQKIAFVGISTPETLEKSTPAYFQNEKGEYIYGVSGITNPEDLAKDVQSAIDAAKAQGATKVIGLGHLGDDPSSTPHTSEETIARLSGLDAFIDGHSHSTIRGKEVKDKDQNTVVLTQTGEYFTRIGMMVINPTTGEITTDFIECVGDVESGYTLSSALYQGKEVLRDPAVSTLKNQWMEEIDERLGQVIGSAKVTLNNYDEQGNRLVRLQSTNSGDFAADALYYLFDDMGLDVDLAVMNGGGVRNQAITGNITYKICKDMHPFGNVACLLTVSGQQILDMLEWSSRNVGIAEDGSFLHGAGVTYKINTAIDCTVTADEMDMWVAGPSGEYRVHDVKIYDKETNTWQPLDLTAKYNLAGYNYTLRDLGGGFAMLKDGVNVVDYVMEDYMVLAGYVQAFENGVIDAANSPLLAKYTNMKIAYADLYGSGRIQAVNGFVYDQEEPTQDQEQETIMGQTPNENPQTGEEVPVVVVGLWFVSAVMLATVSKKRKT